MSGRMNGNGVSIGGNGGNYFFIDWQEAGQSIESNSTVINWQSYFHYNSADAQLDNGIVALSGTRWSNGGRVRNFAADFRTRDVPIASGSFTIGHNSDGTQSIAVSGGIDVYQSGRSSGAQTWALPTIPRNSQVTTNAASYALGDPITIYTNRKSGAFTHTITLRHNNGSGTLLKTFNSVADSVTWTPTTGEIEDMEELIPNSNTFVLHITQRNNQVGADSTLVRNLTLTEANPTFSDFDFRDSDSATVAITGDDQVLVKGKSVLEVEIDSSDKMVAIKSATPDRYDIVYDGVIEEEAYSTSDVTQTFSPIGTIGTRAIIVRAYDSRGNSTTVAKSVQVYDYTPPIIEIDVSRENNFGENVTIKTNGTFDLLPIGGVDKNELTAGSLEYRYKELPSGSFGSWVDIDFTVADNEFEGDDDFVSLDNGKSFEFEFRITDKFGTVTQTATLGAGVPLFFVGENGTVEFNGKNIIEMVYPVGSIYTATVSTNPATLLGFGTWAAYGAGRVIVGKATSGTFATAGSTGGEETHTLTSGEMPTHSHTIGPWELNNTASGSGAGRGWAVNGGFSGTETINVSNAGSGGAHNNLQPYIVAYMWERTA